MHDAKNQSEDEDELEILGNLGDTGTCDSSRELITTRNTPTKIEIAQPINDGPVVN